MGSRRKSLAQLLVAVQGAHQLVRLLPAIYREFNPHDADGHLALDRIVTRIRKLIDDRNRTIHARWTLGLEEADLGDFAIAQALHLRPDKKRGLVVDQLNYKPEDFESLTNEAIELQVYLERLMTCINQPRFNLAEMFNKST